MNGEGRAAARDRRRRVYQMMRPITSVAPTTPPTTPPAIAPVLELFFFEVEPGLVEELDRDVDDADAVEAVDGVPSGVSLAQRHWKGKKKVRKFFSMASFSA